MAYSVKVICDSVSSFGVRLTTIEATFPRFILAEVNTTRQLTKSSASSRAIPVEKRIRMLEEDMFVPEAFSKNQKGMQAAENISDEDSARAREIWVRAANHAALCAKELAAIGVHKQHANRLLEPYVWHTALITGTEWSNHEALRCSPNAQPEYRMFAEMMRDAKAASSPRRLRDDEWHLPYIQPDELLVYPMIDLVRASCARAARVSYLTQAGIRSIDEDFGLYGKLASLGHMAPLEHAARPMTPAEWEAAEEWEFTVEIDGKIRIVHTRDAALFLREMTRIGAKVTDERVTHFCGNFNGWVQHRKELPHEYDFSRREAAF